MTGITKKLMTAGIALVLVAAALAAPAAAEPTGEFAEFKQCEYENKEISTCIHFVFNSGTIQIGKKAIPLKNPITLQGSLTPEADLLHGATSGETLSKTPQPVPGGLVGVTAPTWWPPFLQSQFNEQIGTGMTGINATLELAGPTKGLTNVTLNTENLLFEEGTALTLPVKIHLDSSVLGSNCYIGSDSQPVHLQFTTGTSGGLKGSAGELTFNEEFTIADIAGVRLVDNTFAVPGAKGCGGIFSAFYDPLINSLFGLPSASGKNHAVLEGTLTEADREEVFLSGP
ncbi:MAG TPA: hypothetical protein VMS11_13470 [Solirubrobacterales bacterium]|nr:hypothetical protein [Solirubrobacterales bacterium]